MTEQIKAYWEQRAAEAAGSPTATTDDVHLRELEHRTLVETLEEVVPGEGKRILDLGCGDGLTTLRVARDLPRLTVVGVDYSETMILNARARLEAEDEGVRARVRFEVGDANTPQAAAGPARFDAVLTGRCLINLDTSERQYAAIRSLAQCVRPGGHYIAIENFMGGQNTMNQARAAVGLSEIPVRWHNLFFVDEEFVRETSAEFEPPVFKDFASSYYFATRVVYSGACKARGEEPDYNHEIHQLAPKLPWIGQFSPIRMAILRRKGTAS